MLPREKHCLEVRIGEEVRFLLEVADETSLHQFPSRAAFIAALEDELRFVGLYAHDDQETPKVIHGILEEKLEAFLSDFSDYLRNLGNV